MCFTGLGRLLVSPVTPAMITVDRESTRNLIGGATVVMGMGLTWTRSGRTALVRLGVLVLGGLGEVLLFLSDRSCFFESMTILARMFAGTAIRRIAAAQYQG
ncbi:hypothetical protein, partial [Saccharothrix sp. ST-888]|uniref:hypothetical protein n=1 Tax=Saccharothrix sp. ST-888 TaxID=1427391 RepID=UPI0012E00A4C